MTRTKPSLLVVTALAATVVGYLVDLALVGNGRPAALVPWPVGLVLAVIGAALLLAAWPIRQAVRDAKRTVGYVHATRVLGLAKASSIVGALVGGWAGGITVFLLTRPVVSGDAVGSAVVALAGAVALVVAALLAESWCVLPPDDDGGAAAPSAS